jgi:hypothetical protein
MSKSNDIIEQENPYINIFRFEKSFNNNLLRNPVKKQTIPNNIRPTPTYL